MDAEDVAGAEGESGGAMTGGGIAVGRGGGEMIAGGPGVDGRGVDEELEARFVKEAASEGIVGIVGHRSVGGMRVSLYNAVAIEAVETLVSFMQQFERNRA